MSEYRIWGDSIEDIAGQLTGVAPDRRAIAKRADGRRSLLELLPRASLEKSAFADMDFAGTEFRSLRGDAGLALLRSVAIENPYRSFSWQAGKGFAAPARRPRGVMLPLADDPADFGVPAVPRVEVDIGFAGDGAPAQQHRAPGVHGPATFLRRHEALRAVGFDGSGKRNLPVHVYVVDQGMDPHHVDALGGPGTYGGMIWAGDTPEPGTLPTEKRHRYRTRPQWHAHMIVRNILAIAGDNRHLGGNPAKRMLKIHDVPVIPNRVADVLTTADAMVMQMDAVIDSIDGLPPNAQAIVVNAWGVKNRFRETPVGGLTETAAHPLNLRIAALAARPEVAVIFASGNSGAFSPDPESGPLDRGPGRSIWLPAALASVWNAGATDANGMWIGSSSQGPSGWTGGAQQDAPMFTMPSYFRETADAHVANTGSSASCGMLGGLIAAQFRHSNASIPGPGVPNPLSKANARSKARKRGFTKHSGRHGSGIAQYMKLT